MTESPNFPTAKDPFGPFLSQLNIESSLYCYSRLAGDWSIDMPALPSKMMFHIVTKGNCYVEYPGSARVKLTPGTLVLLPRGNGHLLANSPTVAPVPLFEAGIVQLSERFELLEIKGEGELTLLTCGVVSFAGVMGQHLVNQLPEVIVLNAEDYDDAKWLHQTLDLIAHEAQELNPGSETIITHLADVLLIQIIRHWILHSPQAAHGWFEAIRDRQIGRALNQIYKEPERKWTVEDLASACGMSRSNFSAKFSKLVGKSVKNYLLEWRMTLAMDSLKTGKIPLVKLAEAAGYESEAAFSRAFKRVVGVSPSQVSDLGMSG